MVKNTGGNKSKKQARKNVGQMAGQAVRRAVEQGEMYAAVTKIYSSKRCEVMGADGVSRACTVRGKFIGRRRSGEGCLAPGVWIMIGFYDWEVRGDGSKSCDLLEIYTSVEKEKLKQIEPRQKLAAILSIGELAGAENEFTFSEFHTMGDAADANSDAKLAAADAKLAAADAKRELADSDDDDVYVPVPVPCVPVPVQNQLDWLKIDVRDI
jgi:hypothetical protein